MTSLGKEERERLGQIRITTLLSMVQNIQVGGLFGGLFGRYLDGILAVL